MTDGMYVCPRVRRPGLVSAARWLSRRAATRLCRATASVFFLLAATFGHACYVDADVSIGPFILTIVGFAALMVGGWLGGAITYIYGMRVLNLVDESASRAATPIPTPEKDA